MTKSLLRHRSYLEVLQILESQGQACCAVTLVDVAISAPQKQGARAIFSSEGLIWGTVGGGKVEEQVRLIANEMLATESPCSRFIEWNLRKDIGMTCGGIVRFYFELYHGQPWTINIFGAGHVCQALVPLLMTLDCQLRVFDTRWDWLERLPDSAQVEIFQVDPLEQGLELCRPSDFFLSISPGHSFDVPVIEKLLKQCQPAFLGVIGSKTKRTVMERELKHRQVDGARLAAMYCPVGLAIHGATVAEIAVSIAGQLIQVRRSR